MKDKPLRGLVRALQLEEWEDVFARGLTWKLTPSFQVSLRDPASNKVAVAPTITMAYHRLTKKK